MNTFLNRLFIFLLMGKLPKIGTDSLINVLPLTLLQIYDQMEMFDWPRQYDAIHGEGAAALAKASHLNASQSQPMDTDQFILLSYTCKLMYMGTVDSHVLTVQQLYGNRLEHQ